MLEKYFSIREMEAGFMHGIISKCMILMKIIRS